MVKMVKMAKKKTKINKRLSKEFKEVFDKTFRKSDVVEVKLKESNKHSYKYDILHELAHTICGFSCCREHMEWEAHGGAKILAFLLEIDIGDAEKRMSYYTGISSRKGCDRYGKKTSN